MYHKKTILKNKEKFFFKKNAFAIFFRKTQVAFFSIKRTLFSYFFNFYNSIY